MIQRLSHTPILVHDQAVAHDFYVETLGFDLRMDFDMGGWRWLTVSPKGQSNLELLLLPVHRPMTPEPIADQIGDLLANGHLPTHVVQTADCQETYKELSARGVEFVSPPKDQFYGVEAVFRDPSGNRFSLTQQKEMPARP